MAASRVELSFLCDPALESLLPKPDRAAKFVPNWFRKLGRDLPLPDQYGRGARTVKACMPVADALALGWILPLAADLRVTADDFAAQIQAEWIEELPFPAITQHHPEQVGHPNPPFEHQRPFKWINPWRVKVPPGYSVLFTHPLNHFELPFHCFSGFVDCDGFFAPVNLPFIWTKPACNMVLPRGTPLAQIIPIQRSACLDLHEVRATTSDEVREFALAARDKLEQKSVYASTWRAKDR